MICKICEQIDNKKDDLAHRQMVFCDLLATDGKMRSSGVMCSADCVVYQNILDKVAEMILKSEIDQIDLKKSSWVNMLPERFRNHGMALQRLTGKRFAEIKAACHGCSKSFVDGSDNPIRFVESQAMSDFRGV
jgi:hypothetical protein